MSKPPEVMMLEWVRNKLRDMEWSDSDPYGRLEELANAIDALLEEGKEKGR